MSEAELDVLVHNDDMELATAFERRQRYVPKERVILANLPVSAVAASITALGNVVSDLGAEI